MKFDYRQLMPETVRLGNGIPLYLFPDSHSELLRLEFIFEAGSSLQEKPIQARACSALLEATLHHSADAMTERFDYYGAYMEKYVDRDQSSIVIYALARYSREIIALCEEIFKEAVFSAAELQLYLEKQRSQFDIAMQKVAEVSRRAFFAQVFGERHPYGVSVERTDFDGLQREDVEAFYRRFYVAANAAIVLAGGYGDGTVQALADSFGRDFPIGQAAPTDRTVGPVLPSPRFGFVSKPGALQASVRMGKVVMPPTDAGFSTFKVLDYLFGGYFGSRIMQNIREEKGYTYGISSYILPLRAHTVWIVASEVKQACSRQVVAEIQNEMRKLCDRKPGKKELNIVRQVYQGDFLREMDGIFEIAEKWKFLRMFGLTDVFYRQFAETLENIEPSDIQQAAQCYFTPDSFHVTVCGDGVEQEILQEKTQ
ncbi:MAG: insulinase family protein [Bacteroidales bacterium]|nr:insulinase family protein [Bacteroidales bacterium]